MKNFSLLLFSEQVQSGDKDIPAAAVQENDEAGVLSRGDARTGDNTPAAEESQNVSKTKREIYDEFIRANKEFFTEDTQKIISLRVKEAKEMKATLDAADTEIKSLREELEKNARRVQTPSDEFLASHPDFILESELENETFKELYESGVSVSTAYNAAHLDELIKSAENSARREAVKATLDSVRARGVRARESASSSTAGLNVKRDVSRLTRSQRAEIARRVIAGEDIIFT